jgi:anti-sigma B factor antagonist
MDINVRTVEQVKVVEINGEIDGSTAPEAQARILPLAEPGGNMILDMSHVGYMSSAGLRFLLVTYRTITGRGGKVVLVGLSEDLKDTMSVTGFLDFFTHHDTLDAGLADLSVKKEPAWSA